jgi:DNA-repair protein XRCC1
MGLDLGAKYNPEWTPSTTHLICAVADTPKAKQVHFAATFPPFL